MCDVHVTAFISFKAKVFCYWKGCSFFTCEAQFQNYEMHFMHVLCVGRPPQSLSIGYVALGVSLTRCISAFRDPPS